MKRVIAITAMFAAFGLGGAAAFAATMDKPPDTPRGGNDGQVCPAGDSGKIDVSLGASVTVTAPDGKLISGYCVKAGSANQGLGPEFVSVDPPLKTVTITHSSGKDISHYSLTYVDEGQTTTTETTTTTERTTTETTTTDTTTTSTTETTPAETGTTETTSTETTSTETTPAETTPTETTPATGSDEQPPAHEPGVFTPPAQQKTGAAESEVASAVGSRAAAQPGKAAQPAPFTP